MTALQKLLDEEADLGDAQVEIEEKEAEIASMRAQVEVGEHALN